MRRRMLSFLAVLVSMGFAQDRALAGDPTETAGPNACAECHKQEVEAWKGTHHFKTFREMPRNAKGKQIAKRLGVRRIKSESLCLGCHYTVQQKDGGETAVSGISCESCHGAGKEWIKVESTTGKTFRFLPEWVGGSPQDGGHNKKEIVEQFHRVDVGDIVRVKWMSGRFLRSEGVQIAVKATRKEKHREEED